MPQAARWRIRCWWSWWHLIPVASSSSHQSDVDLLSAWIWKGSSDVVHARMGPVVLHGYPLDDVIFAVDPSWLKDLCRVVLATNSACRSTTHNTLTVSLPHWRNLQNGLMRKIWLYVYLWRQMRYPLLEYDA
jgi:hypothetical protein